MSNEKDPNGADPHKAGAKLDAGKAPVRRGLLEYFPRACLAVAQISAAGAAKYTWNGWESVPDGKARYGDAEARHICKAAIEGPIDHDFGLPHSAHEAWNAMARLELELREAEGSTAVAAEPLLPKPVCVGQHWAFPIHEWVDDESTDGIPRAHCRRCGMGSIGVPVEALKQGSTRPDPRAPVDLVYRNLHECRLIDGPHKFVRLGETELDIFDKCSVCGLERITEKAKK